MIELARSVAAAALWSLVFLLLVAYAGRRVANSWPDAVLIAYPAFFALQMLLAKLLAFAGLLTSGGALVAYGLLAGVGGVWYLRRSPTALARDGREAGAEGAAATAGADTDARLVGRLTIGIAAVVIAGMGVFSLISPVYVWDALAYHMTMVASYIQNGSLAPWPTQDLRQIVRVNGGELQLLNITLLSGSDAWVELPNLLGLAVCLVAAYALARHTLRHRALPYLVVALVLTAPQIQVGAGTAKNDLVFTAVLLGAFYWATRAALDGGERAATYAGLAAVSGALATATKVLGLNVLGAVGLLILTLVVMRRLAPRVLVNYCTTAAVALVVLVGDVYWYNLTRSAVPVGIAPTEVFFRTGLINLTEAARYYVYDLSIRRLLAPQVFEHDFLHYGYLWPLVFGGGVAAIVTQAFVRTARRRGLAALALMAAALFVSVIAVRTPIGWDQRFMIWMVPTFAILTASLLERLDIRRVLVLTTAAVSLSFVSLMLTLSNEAGGLFVRSGRHLVRTGLPARYIDVPTARDVAMAEGFAVLDEAADTSRVLYVGSDDSWMYPSWGRRFTRRVRGVWGADDATEQITTGRHDFIIIESEAAPPLRTAALDAARRRGYQAVVEASERVVLRRSSVGPAGEVR